MAEKRSGLIVIPFPDYLRGSSNEVALRLDPNDVVTLPCHCEYDPALVKPEGNQVMLLRKAEVRNPDGSWSPYPSVTWLDEAEQEEQLVTRALIKKTEDGCICIMSSTDGVPDGKLIVAAEEAGIYTETPDG